MMNGVSFAQNLLNGMGAAGWVIGLLAALGLFLVFVGLLVLAALTVAEWLDKREEKEATGDEGAAEAGSRVHAPGVAGYRRPDA